MTALDAGRAGSATQEAEIERLRQCVAEVEAENVELRRARRVVVEVVEPRSSPEEAGRAALRASEERYRLVVESATDYAIFTMDLDRRITGWNTGAERVLGWTEAEVVGLPADVIFTPEDREAGAPEQEARGAVEAGRAEDVRWHLRRDGSRLWANGVMLPLLDDAGAIRGLLKILRDKTAEKRAGDELRLEREFLAALIRQAPLGISVVEAPSGRAVVLNDKARELIGHGELGGDAGRYEGYGAVHPDGRPYTAGDYPTVRALTRGEAVEREEMLYRRGDRDGTEPRRLEVSSAPVRDAAGTIVGAVTVLTDVEERRRAEEALRASEAQLVEERARLAALVEHLPVGVCFVGQDGAPLLSNPAFRRFLPGGAIPSRMADNKERWLAWDAGGERLPRTLYPGARALRGEAVPGVEFLHRAEDSMETWTRVSGVPLRDAEGQVAAALVVIADIDEQKRAQEALLRLNETLEARVAERTAERDRMWRRSRDLMLVARFDGAITAANPAWTALLGWREGELVGRSFMDLVHPDDVAPTLAEMDRLSRGLTTLRFENRYRHKDGGHRWLSWTAVPDAGVIHAVARDVTAEKAQAEALVLAEEQLRQAHKMEAVGQLASGIAHDFNNMLQGIGGAVELAWRRVEQGRAENAFPLMDAARKGVERAAALTHRLLAFARRQALDAKPVVLDELVLGMAELIGRAMGPGVEVRTRMGDGSWPVLCDANQLENALLNLALNARDAMSDGGALTLATQEVRLSAADLAGQDGAVSGEYVELCVSDTGAGMAPAVAARAFEPFFTTKPIGQGTGLGLSQVYGFVRQSGGVVRLDSAPGRGTAVRLYLPRHRGAETAAAAEAPDQGREGGGAGKAVLLVEDEGVVRAVAAEALRELGYVVLEAGDGPAGLHLLAGSARVDMLVTDVGLPGMNGRQLAEAAREHRPGLPVLFITGYAGDALRGQLAPGMEVVGKPFTLDALVAKVHGLVKAGTASPSR